MAKRKTGGMGKKGKEEVKEGEEGVTLQALRLRVLSETPLGFLALICARPTRCKRPAWAGAMEKKVRRRRRGREESEGSMKRRGWGRRGRRRERKPNPPSPWLAIPIPVVLGIVRQVSVIPEEGNDAKREDGLVLSSVEWAREKHGRVMSERSLRSWTRGILSPGSNACCVCQMRVVER